MLGRIRKNTKLILWILLALIVPPFLFFGIESVFVSKGDPIVAYLFGKKILKSDYWKERTLAATMLSLQHHGEINPMILDQLAWQRMILLKQARDSGLEVSDQELAQAILKIFPGGKFDRKTYDLFIRRSLKLSVFEFEKAFRETLLIQKFQESLSKLVQVSPTEVHETFLRENERLKVRYCEIPSERFINAILLTPEEIKEYYKKNRESFRVGTQRKLQYMAIPLEGFKVNADIPQKEVEKHYRKNRKAFDKPLNDVAGEIREKLQLKKANTMARKVAKQIYRELLAKKSISEISLEYGYTLQETNFFQQGTPPSPFDARPEWSNTFFKGKLKKPLKPISINNTFYVVIPITQKASFIPSLKEVREKIKGQLTEEKAREKARIEAQDIRTKIQKILSEEPLSFENASTKVGEKSLELPLFSRREARGDFDPIKRSASNISKGDLSNLVPTQKGYAFLVVEESVTPDEKEFEPQKKELHERSLMEKRQKMFAEYDNWLLRQCRFLKTAEEAS